MGNTNAHLQKQLKDLTDKHNKLKDLLSVEVVTAFGGSQYDRDVLYDFIQWVHTNYKDII